MNLEEGASNEILARWPAFKQRNVALDPDCYGERFRMDMLSGIQIIRDHHNNLQEQGETTWTIDPGLEAFLDELAQQ